MITGLDRCPECGLDVRVLGDDGPDQRLRTVRGEGAITLVANYAALTLLVISAQFLGLCGLLGLSKTTAQGLLATLALSPIITLFFRPWQSSMPWLYSRRHRVAIGALTILGASIASAEMMLVDGYLSAAGARDTHWITHTLLLICCGLMLIATHEFCAVIIERLGTDHERLRMRRWRRASQVAAGFGLIAVLNPFFRDVSFPVVELALLASLAWSGWSHGTARTALRRLELLDSELSNGQNPDPQ